MTVKSQRTLALSIGGILVFAVVGATMFHVRALRGADSLELMGWAIIIAAGCMSTASIAIERYSPHTRAAYRRTWMGILAGSALMSLLPFALMNLAFNIFPMEAHKVLFSGTFAVTAATIAVIAILLTKDAFSSESGEEDE